jgi:hypothetical protein
MDAQEIQTALAVLIMLPVIGIYIWSIVWAYHDAERRGKSGCLVVLMVMLLTWPVGLLIWLVFRPDEKGE